MATLEITIDDGALERAERIAHSHHITVQQWASDVIQQQVHITPTALLGFLADDVEASEAIDEIVKARSIHRLREVAVKNDDA